MQGEIKFSVVIPTYNRANLIQDTLNSVFAQTYANYEILVVDNCSIDNTEEVLKPLISLGKIKYIKNEKNFERAYSRNVGLTNATGDYLTLLDSDDFLMPNCLQDAYDFILNNHGIKVFHNLSVAVNDEREVVYRFKYPPISNQYKTICRGNFMSAIGGFIHRDIYTICRFDEDPKMIGAEDYEFWFKVLAMNKVKRINKVNSQVREHPARSTNIDAYNNLNYQLVKMTRLIEEQPAMAKKYGKYTGTLKAAFTLQDIIVHKKRYSLTTRVKLLFKAVKNDFSVIFTKRFLSVTYNIFKK